MRTSLLVLLLAAEAAAQQYSLDYVLPRGGTRGTTVEVTLHGRELQQPREILFYGQGIRATAVTAGAKPGEVVKARFEIAPDCRPGEHVLRLRTATSLTEAVTFWVSPFPSIAETETKIGDNDTIAKAQPVAMNSTIDGQILSGPEPDVDVYRVEARAGERISAEAEAVRLGTLHQGGENDLALRILDSDGHALTENDDSALFVQDPLVSTLAPRDGAYFIEVRQQVYTPVRMGYYRLHVGRFSRPTAIYPAGGQAGTTIKARILGDPAGERTESIKLPAQAGDFDYFAGARGEQPPSPNRLRVSPFPNVLHTMDPTPVPALPAALNGIIAKPGQTDSFRFTAAKGSEWTVHVWARTLGAPLDPRISIREAVSGRSVLEADDAKPIELTYPMRGTWHVRDLLDPIAIFRPPAAGDYILSITDTRGAGSPDAVYRVEIAPLTDAIYTHISMPDGYQIPRLTGLIVPQGGQWTLDVQLAQAPGNRYHGEIELEAVGLPRGVTMHAPRFPAGATRMPVEFVAAPNAEQQAAVIELRAKPVAPGAKFESGTHQSFAAVDTPGEYPWHYVFLDRYMLAVTEPAPFRVEVVPPAVALAQSGDLALTVKVTRQPGFNGAIEVQPDWLPAGVSKAGSVTIPAGQSSASFVLHAGPKAPAGSYQIAMNATTQGGDAFSGVGRIRVSSPFVKLDVARPYLSLDFSRAAIERGRRAEIIAKVNQNRSFTGDATAVLQRLPKGVRQLAPAAITPADHEVKFELEADDDALAGLYRDIACEVTVKDDGQAVKQQTGSGILRVDPARSSAPQPAQVVKP